MKSANKATQKSARRISATGKEPSGFTDDERAAMRERLQELKSDAPAGPSARAADGDSAVLAKIAELTNANADSVTCAITDRARNTCQIAGALKCWEA
jgi:hypothetical protein